MRGILGSPAWVWNKRLPQISCWSFLSYSTLDGALFFGYEANPKGFLLATPEKAVLDTLYFYLRGKKFYFNIFGDIHYGSLDKDTFFEYLARYRNPKFRTFAERCFYGKF